MNLNPLRHLVWTVFLSLTFFFAACDRKVNNMTTVTLIVPSDLVLQSLSSPDSPLASQKVEAHSESFGGNLLLGTDSRSTIDYNSFWKITPTGPGDSAARSGGRYDLNCFLVMVSSSSGDLNDNACYTGSTQAFTYGRYTDTAILTSADITVDVPNGNGRVFLLLGMHADTNYDCYFLTRPPYTSLERVSNMYLVAKSAATDIVGDQTAILLDHKQIFDLSKRIDSCGSTGGHDLLVQFADTLNVTTDTGMFGGNVPLQQCVPVNIRAKSSLTGQSAYVTAASDYALSSPSTSATVNSYGSYQDCVSNTSPSVNFKMTNKTEEQRWVKSGSTETPNQLLDVSGTGLLSINNIDKLDFGLVSVSSTVVPMVYYPSTAAEGACLPIKIALRSPDWSNYTNANTSSFLVTSTVPTVNPGSVTYWSDPNCTLTAGVTNNLVPSPPNKLYQSTISANGTPMTVDTVYVKFLGFTSNQTVVHTVYSTGHTSTYRTNVVVTPVFFSITSAPPMKNSFVVEGPTQFFASTAAVSNTACLGPYKVSLTNYYGAELDINTSSVSITPQVSFTGPMKMFADVGHKPPCDSTTEISSGINFQNFQFDPEHTYSRLFYLQAQPTALQVPGTSAFPQTQYVVFSKVDPNTMYPLAHQGVIQLHFSIDASIGNIAPAAQNAPFMRYGETVGASGGMPGYWFP
ncbi:MAG: hypothetical protein ACXVAX_04110 [Pseudobdellovibrio sp.]